MVTPAAMEPLFGIPPLQYWVSTSRDPAVDNARRGV